MFSLLIGGLELHAAGLPKWMAVKDVDHLSAKEKSRIVSLLSPASARPSVAAVRRRASRGSAARANACMCGSACVRVQARGCVGARARVDDHLLPLTACALPAAAPPRGREHQGRKEGLHEEQGAGRTLHLWRQQEVDASGC